MSELPIRERVPEYHYASAQSRAIIESLDAAAQEAKAAWQDVLAQLEIDTATWGIPLWEWQVGIETDNTRPLSSRRSAIKQRLLACGNTTAERIQELAKALTGYDACVVDNHDYSFSLSFWGAENQLAEIDIKELTSIVEEIKPAHLRFVLPGITWRELESVKLTWRYFEDTNTSWARLESMFCVHKKE